LDQRKYEYQIVPDVRRAAATEIFSVDEVVSIDPQNRETMVFEPSTRTGTQPFATRSRRFGWRTGSRLDAGMTMERR
jgi:type VI protein secretion system component VasA